MRIIQHWTNIKLLLPNNQAVLQASLGVVRKYTNQGFNQQRHDESTPREHPQITY